jgi:hypothetical protein
MTLKTPSWRYPALLLLSAATLMSTNGLAVAQSLRDPTLPPAAALPAQPASGASGTAEAMGPLSIIARNGKSFVVMGTRLYAQGQMLGQARIERIAETEIWLREGKQLRKVQLFSGVTRRAVSGAPTNPARP